MYTNHTETFNKKYRVSKNINITITNQQFPPFCSKNVYNVLKSTLELNLQLYNWSSLCLWSNTKYCYGDAIIHSNSFGPQVYCSFPTQEMRIWTHEKSFYPKLNVQNIMLLLLTDVKCRWPSITTAVNI